MVAGLADIRVLGRGERGGRNISLQVSRLDLRQIEAALGERPYLSGVTWTMHTSRIRKRLAGIDMFVCGMDRRGQQSRRARGTRGAASEAAALGHESFSTTARHYARAEAIEGAQQNRVLEKFTVVHRPRSSPSRAA